MASISSTLSNLLSGRQCKVERREADWNFSFGKGLNIGASVPWRVVTPEGIGHGGDDDGQRFGLPQPVDGEAKANELLGQQSVVTVEADEVTADLRITFEGGLRLDLFNQSAGYEGWQAHLDQGEGQPLVVVALGGGGFTTFLN
jgi:hypothetical protein